MRSKGKKITLASFCAAALLGISLFAPGNAKNNNFNLNAFQPRIAKAAAKRSDESHLTDPETWKAVQEIRTTWKANDDKRDAGLPHDIPQVKRYDNLRYGKDPKWNSLDLYVPKKVHGKIPVIIAIHGGGWVYGTKETYQYYGLGMAKRGFAFVNANYILGPENKYPAELNQVDQYVHWVAKNAKKYNLDKNNVFLVGDSAGGQMAEQYTAILTNSKYRKKFGYKLTDLKFRAVALNSPAAFMMDNPITDHRKAYFSPKVMKSKKNQDSLNVEKYITKHFLPTFISTANQDPLHDTAVKLGGFLRGRGVPVIQKSWGDANHPEPHVFLINQKDSLANEANNEEASFFDAHLAKNNSKKTNHKKHVKKHSSKKRKHVRKHANKRHAKKTRKRRHVKKHVTRRHHKITRRRHAHRK